MNKVSKYLLNYNFIYDEDNNVYYGEDDFIVIIDKDYANNIIKEFDEGYRICLENRHRCDYNMKYILIDTESDSIEIFKSVSECYFVYIDKLWRKRRNVE